MAAIWVKAGLKAAIEAIFLDNATPDDKMIAVFTNNETIDTDTVYSDLTIHDANSVSPTILTKASWGAATSADPSVIRYDVGNPGITFTFSGGGATLYGWCIYEQDSPNVLLVQHFLDLES